MKKFAYLIVLVFAFTCAAKIVAAGDLTTSTQTSTEIVPMAGGGGGGGGSSPIFDARRFGRAFLSHDATVDYTGGYSYPLQASSGGKLYVSGNYRARYYYENGIRKFKLYQFNISYNNGTPIEYDGDPMDVFPYPKEGAPIGIYIYINGYDAKGSSTCYGNYNSQSWQPGDSFQFYTKPGTLPIIIKFDLAGRDPNSVGLIIDSWGGAPMSYDVGQGGFIVWLDPLQQYSGRIVDLWNNQATIVPLPPFSYDSIPSTTPTGSALNFSLIGGVQTVAFDQNGMFDPHGDCWFNTSIPKDGQSLPAAVYIVEEPELQGQSLYISVMNFAGRVQVETFPKTDKIFLDQVWSTPFTVMNIEVPAGYKSVMITIIKENVPVTIPVNNNWDSNKFNLFIGRYWSGGLG